jgi:hypothetical protein
MLWRANPYVAGHRGHRVGVFADPPAGLRAGPLGQHRPRSDPSHRSVRVCTPQEGSRQR